MPPERTDIAGLIVAARRQSGLMQVSPFYSRIYNADNLHYVK